jgi:hypothetical protein
MSAAIPRISTASVKTQTTAIPPIIQLPPIISDVMAFAFHGFRT